MRLTSLRPSKISGNTFILLLAVVWVIFFNGCGGGGSSQPLPPLLVDINFSFATGNEPQALNYRWFYYAGSDVTSFKVEFGNSTLPSQAHVNLIDGTGQLIERREGDIGGWSAPIPGNRVIVQLWSRPVGAVPQVSINRMEYTRSRGPIFPEEPQPGGQTYSTAYRLSHNIAEHGYLRGTDFADYYVAPNLSGKDIDIVVSSDPSGAELDVYISYDEFLVAPDNARHHLTATQNSPAFIEFDPAPRDKLYITVKSKNGAGKYYIAANHVRHKFSISYEFEGDQYWNRTAPNGQTYFELARATALDASRRLYDATDGMMRFDEVTIYKTERDFTVADVYIHDEVRDRATSNSWDIDIGRNHLEDTGKDGATIVHEWGHYEWGLDDEYDDSDESNTLFQCPNSLMSTYGAVEYCIDINHDPTGELGGDSVWAEIFDEYSGDRRDPGYIPRQVDTPNSERFNGLNLEPFIQWRIFE